MTVERRDVTFKIALQFRIFSWNIPCMSVGFAYKSGLSVVYGQAAHKVLGLPTKSFTNRDHPC